MPIYEYACEKCGEKFEKLLKTARGADEMPCPKCGSAQTTRALSVFAAVSSEGKSQSSPASPMCGRCGGPGPCAMG